jgi:cytochrome d ubiquinol oxidase subunit I
VDAEQLARIQFALTVGFHFFFPSITIGLAGLIVVLETLRHRTQREVYDRAAVFWTRIFALTFAIGVATGIVMEFQFGTNWASYSAFVGDIFGSPLAAEGILAFFLESVFLGLLLFGRGRVSSRVRWFAALMVFVGTLLSAVWILIANSWMQTPAGYQVIDGQARLTDFFAAALNPSTIPRYLHTVSSALTAGAFVMLGVSAWYVLKGKHLDVAKVCLPIALVVAFIGSGLMFATGDISSQQVAATQPAKFAGINALYETRPNVPLTIPLVPPTQDLANQQPGPRIEIGGLLSFLTYRDVNASITGLAEFPADEWPPVTITWGAYHLMVLLGTVMLLVMLLGAWFLWRGSVWRRSAWLKLAVLATPLPLIAIQLGWTTAEVGRQPWIVYGLMRTSDGVSVVVPAEQVALSLGLLVAMYVLLGGLWLYLVRKELGHGPAPAPVGAAAAGEIAGPGATPPADASGAPPPGEVPPAAASPAPSAG